MNKMDILLQSLHNFKDYKIPESSVGSALVNELDSDSCELLRSLGYRSGTYKVHINVQRRKIFNNQRRTFRVKEI